MPAQHIQHHNSSFCVAFFHLSSQLFAKPVMTLPAKLVLRFFLCGVLGSTLGLVSSLNAANTNEKQAELYEKQEQIQKELEAELESHLQESDSFITPQEYGANLYENPRGIGCVKCHGKDGEEFLLASYTHKGKQKHIIVPRINNLAFEAFKIALSKDSGVMPKYNLTDEEINAIYLYITSRNKTFAR